MWANFGVYLMLLWLAFRSSNNLINEYKELTDDMMKLIRDQAAYIEKLEAQCDGTVENV